MYYRFGKAIYFLSVLVFVFTLLYFYSAMPEFIGIGLNEDGEVDRTWEKGTFFYAMTGFFVVLNFATLFLPKSLETKTNKKLHRIFPIGDPYRDYLLTWFYSFGGIINLSLAFSSLYVHAVNNQEEAASATYNFWFFLMPALLLIWVIALFILLIEKFKAIQKS